MAATLNLAARLSVRGTVIRVDAKDRPASEDGRFAAERVVEAVVLTDGGGFVQVRFPEESAGWAEHRLGAGEIVHWLLDLNEGKGERGGWSRLSFVGAVDSATGTPVTAVAG